MEQKKIEIPFFLALFIVVSFLTFFVFKPFLKVLVLSAVAALLFEPLYGKVLSRFGNRKSFSAFLTVFCVSLFVIIPLSYVGTQVVEQSRSLYAVLEGDRGYSMEAIKRAIEDPVRLFFPEFVFDVRGYAVNTLRFISENFNTFVSQALAVFFQTLLFLLAFFFFLRDGRKMTTYLISLSPFENRHTQIVFSTTRHSIVSLIREMFAIILIRLILVGVSFYLCGIPNAVFWGSLAGIVGAIPSLGTPVVIIPAAIYLYSGGYMASTVGIIIVGLFIMLVIENILAPYLLGRGFDVSPLVALLSVFGGLVLFGPFGLIFGPIILSLFLSAIHMYKIIYLKQPSD